MVERVKTGAVTINMFRNLGFRREMALILFTSLLFVATPFRVLDGAPVDISRVSERVSPRVESVVGLVLRSRIRRCRPY